ncbi:hypothetical protein V202x_48440 [Gimesia aquarii]|uniref:Uncharacterized protein n=1 Tax=Gimesia aquarii TaxID=2527964 RepID=A0A517X1P2_9PLAN|nr:hypothetical protein V202x_48440 [Gimesia aquarii]
MKIKKQINPVKVWKWTVTLLALICWSLLLLGCLSGNEQFIRWSSILLIPLILFSIIPLIGGALVIFFEKRRR